MGIPNLEYSPMRASLALLAAWMAVVSAAPAQLRMGLLHPSYKTSSSSFAYDKGGSGAVFFFVWHFSSITQFSFFRSDLAHA